MKMDRACIGVIKVSWWYFLVDAEMNDKVVYRSNGMPPIYKDPMENVFVHTMSKMYLHAAVLCGYRDGDVLGMHALVMGTKKRWVQSQEILSIYTLQVEPMDPIRRVKYPLSGSHIG
jgi:hypothetical protein